VSRGSEAWSGVETAGERQDGEVPHAEIEHWCGLPTGVEGLTFTAKSRAHRKTKKLKEKIVLQYIIHAYAIHYVAW
jgi:hypothetical protein